ncbi:hypothetical protein IW262DRAFT_1300251 [Armillaria fumosa]|nr:hypothetical protein IW262DRAFT_1300251 [Armillaria fumosa]
MHCDFKLGEFILDAALTSKQMTTLFELLTPDSESTQGFASTIKTPRDFKEHWDQAANLITPFEKSMNLTLEPHFFWDTIQLSKWNGKAFKRFIDEPWTAQAFWDLQTPLPKGAKPHCFILYADKTHLSSFGTAQGYPVVTCCANLRAEIQNGNGIKDNQRYKNKTYYMDFKQSVWHAAMKYILEPLKEPSKVESWVHLQLCDEDLQTFPRVPIISCDFEEVYQQPQTQTREILGDAAGLPMKDAQNKFLSGFGLHNIQFIGQADDQIKLFPCWKDLYHFESGFMGVHFTDGGKYKDLAKHILFVTQNILTETCNKHGYHLLKCMRSYLELNTYAAFNLHTETTMQAIREELIKFSELIKKYEQLTMSVKQRAKSWNFPKIHSHKHLVDDIMMHGPLKDAYQLQTNFKEVAEQILHVDLWCNAASFIHQQIDLQEELLHQATSEDDDEVMAGKSGKAMLHGHCGKGGRTFKIKELPILRADNAAYEKFKDRLSAFMVGQFAKHPKIILLVSGEKMSFKAFKENDEIQLYGLLKVNYENTVDWNMCTDYLRCSPDFYNHPRYDCVIVKGLEGPFFAQTIMLFSCIVGGKSFPLVLVHPFDKPVGASNAKLDKDLGFYRVRAQKRTKSLFISIYNVIHGALLVKDYGFKSPDGMKEYLVVDSVDSDLFLRMKSLKYIGHRWN